MKNKLLIKAPVNSLRGAKMQISAGAGEIYVGFDYEYFNEFTFSGRYKNSNFNKKSIVPSYEEFKEIVKIAHEKGVLVELVANLPYSTDLNYSGEVNLKEHFLKYVNMGVEAGVDRVIVGDIGNIIFLKKNNVKAKITVSTFIGTLNKYQAKFFEKLGVDKIVLPHPIKLSEVKEIVDSTNLNIELFGHYGCSFLEGTCNLLHRSNNRIEVGIPCRGCYKVKKTSEETNILDMNEDCTICQLKEIMELGVDSIKIIGRDLEPEFMSTLTAVYSIAIEMYSQGMDKKEVLKALKEEFDFGFWEEQLCGEKRCKFKDTTYYI